MTAVRMLKTTVFVRPEDLGKDIFMCIRKHLEATKSRYNTKDKGSVVKLHEVIGYRNRVHASTGSMRVDVQFSATTFLPRKGMRVRAKIDRQISCGIVCVFSGVHMWVHGVDMDPYKWDESSGCFAYNGELISQSTSIEVEVATIRYENKTFSCIAKIVNAPP